MSRTKLTWIRRVWLSLISSSLAGLLGCHHYVCDGCGGCGGSCAGGNVYVVPADQKTLLQPSPAETIRKLPTPTQ